MKYVTLVLASGVCLLMLITFFTGRTEQSTFLIHSGLAIVFFLLAAGMIRQQKWGAILFFIISCFYLYQVSSFLSFF